MAEERGRRDPLSWLIGPVSEKDFLECHYEQRALHCGHADTARFAELLSLDRIDAIIASSELPSSGLSMARSQPPLKRSDYTFKSGNIDRGAVVRLFQRGATVILNQLQRADETMAGFCRSLEEVFSCHVQSNAYLTPPGNQGFNTHYDDHDVFIVQVHGEKQWRLYAKPVENPYSGEGFKAGVHSPGEIQQEFLLRAGDCLYIPRGLMHDASVHGDDLSLHITVGLIVKKWADLMLEAISEVALKNPKFRRSLPPGYARPDSDKNALEARFRELAREFAEQADFGEVLAYFQENFAKLRRPNLSGALIDAASPITENDLFVRRPFLQAILRRGESEAVIVAPGGNVHFDGKALAGLEVFLSGEPFSIAAFAELDEEQSIETIRKLSAFGLIERAQ